MPTPCVWREDEYGRHYTGCGEMCIDDETAERGKFCRYCGAAIREVRKC